MLEIRELKIDDYQGFRELRQCHLDTDPQSVSTSASDWKSAPREKVEALLSFEDSRSDDFILGAFVEENLVGMLGFKRETRKPSTMHKGTFWGFFVRPEMRKKSIGKALVEKALALAKGFEWCEMIRVMITTTDKAAINIAEGFQFSQYGRENKSLKINGEYFDDFYYSLYLK